MDIQNESLSNITKKINERMSVGMRLTGLYNKLIVSACSLVALRFGADLCGASKTGLAGLLNEIEDHLPEGLMLDEFDYVIHGIVDGSSDKKDDINLIDSAVAFSEMMEEVLRRIDSQGYDGSDVMASFFACLSMYKKKSEYGQVFTPEHIIDFMFNLCECDCDSVIFDGACGSGSFLTKAMQTMVRMSPTGDDLADLRIKSSQLYGIEFDREVFVLACANAIVLGYDVENLLQGDTRSAFACEWIRNKLGNKRNVRLLMNPPYENKFGCMEIVKNCLDNVPAGSTAAFILPEKKLEKSSKKLVTEILDHHRLEKIIKLPENLFFGVGVSTSIFVFKTGTPQRGQEIYTAYIEDDGLEVVKNQGRHDIHNRWPAISERALRDIRRLTVDGEFHGTWIDSKKYLSYQVPPKPFEIREEDFQKTALDYLLWQKNVNVSELKSKLIDRVLYSGELVDADTKSMTIRIEK